MKFALCNELFEAWNTDKGFDFPRVFEYIKKCGYDGVEIAPFTIDKDAFFIPAARRVEIRRLAEQNGLEITGLHWLLAKTEGYYLTSPDPVLRQKTAGYFQELIRLCADLGGRFMVLGSPQQRNLLPDVTRDQAFDYAADVLQKLVPMLEKCDVQIALEPLSPKETNFLTTAAETVRLIEKVGVPSRVALHLDCKAMASEALSIPELIRANRQHMIYFHLNDPNLQGPGFGELDFVPIMDALLDIGYKGWASVEVFDFTPGIETLAEKSLSHTKQCLEEALKKRLTTSCHDGVVF
jgi:sugar phosphate isomerase/epimerase